MDRRVLLTSLPLVPAAFTGTARRAGAVPTRLSKARRWPLWESYRRHFIDDQGRVIDRTAGDRSTSEGQAYSLFFSLAADDRATFDRVLEWTVNNLAKGDLAENLPAWHWGRDASGRWSVLDSNSASDADCWLAYTLLEAGRIWNEPSFSALGRALAEITLAREVRDLVGLGPALLPAPKGFQSSPDVFQLNPSYYAPQVLHGLATHLPSSRWGEVSKSSLTVLRGARRGAFVLDWVAYRQGQGFHDCPVPNGKAKASYDAIRVYLWLGMLHRDAPDRRELRQVVEGMAEYLESSARPPTEADATGTVTDPNGSAGFSAACLPLVDTLGKTLAKTRLLERIRAGRDGSTGLYGVPPTYYDQNLILFSLGWLDGFVRFTPKGTLDL